MVMQLVVVMVGGGAIVICYSILHVFANYCVKIRSKKKKQEENLQLNLRDSQRNTCIYFKKHQRKNQRRNKFRDP